MAASPAKLSQNETSWLIYAIASGACAALNGALAKLTTTSLTSNWAVAAARLIGIDEADRRVDLAIRGAFFLCNLAFNGIMWGLFTRALTLANSTVRVSVINTSANFVITAILGLLVFGESLPPLWWVGASLLVAGSVIIGRRDGQGEAEVNIDPLKKDHRHVSTSSEKLKKGETHVQTSSTRQRIPARLQDDW